MGPEDGEKTWYKRGARLNPAGRFATDTYEEIHEDRPPEEEVPGKPKRIGTRFYKDRTEKIIADNNSPDVPFDISVNPYRGCEHGCIYCYARPGHEFLGFSAGLDFETKIMVKEQAPALLRRAINRPGWQVRPIAFSGVTDCYQPAERRFRLTRACLEVLAEHRHPTSVITKNSLILRDLDILRDMAARNLVSVAISVTSLDDDLCRVMEPRTSLPEARLETIRRLREAGVPVSIMLSPLIPGINDREIPALLRAGRDAGATGARYILLRLPLTVRDLFRDWLETHFPLRAAAVMNHLTAMGQTDQAGNNFGRRMTGHGPLAGVIAAQFRVHSRRNGFVDTDRELRTDLFRPTVGRYDQPLLFPDHEAAATGKSPPGAP